MSDEKTSPIVIDPIIFLPSGRYVLKFDYISLTGKERLAVLLDPNKNGEKIAEYKI